MEFNKEVENLIEDLFGVRIFTIDFIKDDDWLGADLESFPKNKLGLGLGAFGCINHEKNSVNHAQDTFDLSTKVGMAWGVDDIDADILIFERSVLGFDGDASFPF